MCPCTVVNFLISLIDKTFFQNLIVALLGIPIGLGIDRVIKNWHLKKDRRDLLPAIDEALKHNCDLLNQLKDEFNTKTDGGWMPTYSMDLELLDSTSAQKYQIGISAYVCKKIDTARYELTHFNEKLDLLKSVRVDKGTEGDVMAKAIISSCLLHLNTVMKSIVEARGEIAKITEK